MTEAYPATLKTSVGTLDNEGPDRVSPESTDVEYRAWVGEDHMLTVARMSAYVLRREGRGGSKPWSACIWPRHKDGTRHVCMGWCDRRYGTAADAARALETEYARRYGADAP